MAAKKGKMAFRVATHGLVRTGKSTWPLTAPGRIAYIPLDPNSRYAAETAAKRYGKEVVFAKTDYMRLQNPMKTMAMTPQQAGEYYKTEVMQPLWGEYYGFLESPEIETVVVDSATQLRENVWMRHFGRAERIMPRDLGPANSDMADAITSAYESGKNLILVHRSREVWAACKGCDQCRRTGKSHDVPTGTYEMEGWPHTRSYCSVTVRHFRLDKADQKAGLGFENDFAIRATECSFNPWLVGGTESVLTGDEWGFGNLVERMARIMVRRKDGTVEWDGEYQDWFEVEEWL